MYVFKRDVDLIELNSFFYSNASIELPFVAQYIEFLSAWIDLH